MRIYTINRTDPFLSTVLSSSKYKRYSNALPESDVPTIWASSPSLISWSASNRLTYSEFLDQTFFAVSILHYDRVSSSCLYLC